MLREQRIMERIIDEIGDELNEYITTFNGCDFWKIKEGEIIVNRTFKRLLNIIADFNLTTADNILENVSNLPDSPNEMMFILQCLASNYVNIGGDGILNRTMAFCFILHYITLVDNENNLNATQILEQSISIPLMYKKKSLWQRFKYLIGVADLPYKVIANTRAIGLMSLLSGKSSNEMARTVGYYYDILNN